MKLEEYWSLTPNEFKKYFEAFELKEKNKVIEIDSLNHLLGKYIAYAVNEPKKYPKEPFLKDISTTKKTSMSEEEMAEVIKQNSILLGQ